MQNLGSLFFFFANNITTPARKYDFFIYPLDNILLIYSFYNFISFLLYFRKGTKRGSQLSFNSILWSYKRYSSKPFLFYKSLNICSNFLYYISISFSVLLSGKGPRVVCFSLL
jgi:hypothetical protein